MNTLRYIYYCLCGTGGHNRQFSLDVTTHNTYQRRLLFYLHATWMKRGLHKLQLKFFFSVVSLCMQVLPFGNFFASVSVCGMRKSIAHKVHGRAQMIKDTNAQILFIQLMPSVQLVTDGPWVKVLFLRFQFICTKTIRRLHSLRVNIVNNKRTGSLCDNASKLVFLRMNSQFWRGNSTQEEMRSSAQYSKEK